MHCTVLQGLRCEALGALAALSGLTELDVSLCRGVGEGTLASLQGLQELRVLNASVCPSLTDAGLEVGTNSECCAHVSVQAMEALCTGAPQCSNRQGAARSSQPTRSAVKLIANRCRCWRPTAPSGCAT